MTIEILYQDSAILVCIKPSGIAVEGAVPNLCAVLSEQTGTPVYPVHRLDAPVGGVMVFARTKQSAAALSKAVQEGTMIKEYVALVHGTPSETGDWTDLIFKDSTKNKVFVVKKERRGVKKARLEYKRLTEGETSLVRIRLYTGRSHQIRVQFSSRGFPLVGDRKYGGRDTSPAPMLFSCKLTFPYGKKTVEFEKLPDWA